MEINSIWGRIHSFLAKIKIHRLLRGILPWSFWIEHNEQLFNQEQWHESKVTQLIWNDFIMYTKAVWERVVKFVRISAYSLKALMNGMTNIRGDKHILLSTTQFEDHLELETIRFLAPQSFTWWFKCFPCIRRIVGFLYKLIEPNMSCHGRSHHP